MDKMNAQHGQIELYVLTKIKATKCMHEARQNISQHSSKSSS